MDKHAIKLSLHSNNNRCKINEWFQYHISLGFKIIVVVLDNIHDIELYNIIMFYSNFVSILMNPTTDKYNNTYVLELEINDFLYIPQNNSLLELLNYYGNKLSMTVELPENYLIKKTEDDTFITNIYMLNNDHNKFIKQTFYNFYKTYGFLIVKNLFDKDTIQNITTQAQNIYKQQMISLNMTDTLEVDNNTFEKNMKILFNEHNKTFFNCAKHCQHIIDLWRLSLDDKIINITQSLGVENPIISTRPILFSNSKHISKSDIFHTVPPHQDWATMQGSINSIVCWLPLIDSTQDLGCIAFVPESHKLGLLMEKKEEGFGLVKKFDDEYFKSLDLNQGDALFFSSFLVHKSGNNITENIRWSTHFRYNDLNEKTFIENGYPHAFIYKSIDEILKPDFDTKKAINHYFSFNE
jgi:ectoine hydroxylase-related dioxygenase (phytanoyl-CoA dioxygenase family)